MERLPMEICLKIFSFFDHHHSLASAQQVCRKWKELASNDNLWADLFKERWGEDQAQFYAPFDSKSWQAVYEVQDRCDRVGVGLKIIREGEDYYLIHRGEIQRHLGSRSTLCKNTTATATATATANTFEEHHCKGSDLEVKPNHGILERILFFIGDLEVASIEAKQSRIM